MHLICSLLWNVELIGQNLQHCMHRIMPLKARRPRSVGSENLYLEK